MQVTATEAKNRFGYFCAQAKTKSVVVEKDGRPDSVIVSYEEYEAITHKSAPATLAQRKKAFQAEYREWFAMHNEVFEKHGLWCDGLMEWQG